MNLSYFKYGFSLKTKLKPFQYEQYKFMESTVYTWERHLHVMSEGSVHLFLLF